MAVVCCSRTARVRSWSSLLSTESALSCDREPKNQDQQTLAACAMHHSNPRRLIESDTFDAFTDRASRFRLPLLNFFITLILGRSLRCAFRSMQGASAGLRRAGEWAQFERTVASSGLGTARLPCHAGFDAPAYLTLCFASSLLLT